MSRDSESRERRSSSMAPRMRNVANAANFSLRFGSMRSAASMRPIIPADFSSSMSTCRGSLRARRRATLSTSCTWATVRASRRARRPTASPPADAVFDRRQIAGANVRLGQLGPRLAQLAQPLHLNLADALAGQVQDRPHLFQGDAATIGDVEGTGLGHLPDLEVGEVQLDGARVRVHVEIEVVRAAHERARARGAAA